MKNYSLRIFVSILFITAAAFIAAAAYIRSNSTAAGITAIIIIYLIYNLLSYISRTNRQLTEYISGINYSDFTQNLKIGSLGGNFAELAVEMEKLVSRIKTARFEKEEYLRYLQTVVEHVAIGLISFDSRGNVELLNKGAKKILRINHLRNITLLDDVHKGLGTYLSQVQPKQKSIYKFFTGAEEVHLMVQSTIFRMRNEDYKLISFYNIQTELAEKEIEAWQKLTRVLTHEIMNSITPISSLASISTGLLDQNDGGTISADSVKDITAALNTIQKRSEGLTLFVNKFRDISKIYKPSIQSIRADELFYNVRLLTAQNLASANVSLSVSIEPEEMEIAADANLLTQVLINLINNAVQALGGSENGIIQMSASIDDQGKALIKVIDNGPGISESLMDKIFIPFFTTRPEGSGIGLSISQNIIRAHGGNISVQSDEGRGTVFSISL
ncbi:MAG: sensor histidine kinase [Syntrophothermus sp.]